MSMESSGSSAAPEGILTKRFASFNLKTKKWKKEEMCAVLRSEELWAVERFC
jgi:hypothetical protein